jgi:hypothetical protein
MAEQKKDLGGLFPDLTEDEAIVMRAMCEGDESLVERMPPSKIGAACIAMAEKGDLDQDELDPETGEWVTMRTAVFGGAS